MRLLRLDLHGFKSFPDRTTLHFGPGISVVVGPNGSGKSNVVDALRWCIGEQSARSLRGSEMADVIFGGSTDRKPVGYAEVALTLAASDTAPFPGDWAAFREVQVARRLHRSGTSEYLLNQTRVRRRDVIDLLLDSGIGSNLYAFVEQGQVDKMITASAAERREVIDEAAGIARYKVRRDEAQQRLDATTGQLERAADVLDEMERHLASLGSQVLRAAEFRRLRAVVRQNEITLALAKHHALAEERRALRQQLDAARTEEEGALREVARREEDLAERRAELALVEEAVASRRAAIADLDAEAREHEARRQLHGRRAEELGADAARAAADAATELRRLEAAAADRVAGTDASEAITRETTVAQLESTVARDRAAARSAAVVEDRAALDAAGVRLREASADRAARAAEAGAARTAVTVLARRADDAEARRDGDAAHLDVRLAEATDTARRAAVEVDRRAAAVAEARVAVEAAAQAEREAIAAVERAEAERAAHESTRADVLAAIEAAEARGRQWLDALAASADSAARDDLDGEVATAGRAASAARAAFDRSTAAVAAIDSTLAALEAERDALHPTPADLPPAASLLDRIDAGDRTRAVEVLGDRATLPVVDERAVLARLAEGGTSAEVVYWPGGTLPALAIGWADSLDDALAAVSDGRPRAGPGFRVDPDGVVRLGQSIRAARDTALAEQITRARQDRDLAVGAAASDLARWTETDGAAQAARGRLREHEVALRATLDAREEARRWIDARRAEVDPPPPPVDRSPAARAREHASACGVAGDRAVAAWTAALAASRDADAARDRHLRDADTVDAAASRAVEEAARAREDAAVAARRVASLDAAAAVAASEERQTADAEQRCRAAVSGAEREQIEAAAAVRRAEEVVAALGERRATAAAGVVAAARREEEAAARRDAADAERARFALASAQALSDARAAADGAAAVAERRGVAWDALEAERARAATLAEASSAAERAQRELRDRAETAGRVAAQLAERWASTQASIEALRTSMDDRYQISVAGLLDRLFSRGAIPLQSDPEVEAGVTVAGRTVTGVPPRTVTAREIADEDGVREAVQALELDRAALSALGEVNLGAPAAYAELDERRGGLSAQVADLEASVATLRDSITKTNRLCRERFRDAFDRVNDAFQQAYPQLVGGGSARLSLTDDEDLLETGVDIFVQPPGKRLQHLQLLSGGEKAMTAIALLIALFRVKPSPFCVLDEVDAPLDDANGARFNDVLRDMARHSQFLVVTHNRKTMECADAVYGITMARPGVSTLVSVAL